MLPFSQVTVETELEKYTWHNAKWTADKLIASSPFRKGDHRASFYVWLQDSPMGHAYAGYWGDSGAVEERWSRGSFIPLLAYLRGETEEETHQYLQETYGLNERSCDAITLHTPRLSLPNRPKALDIRLLDKYTYRHSYLRKRGVSDKVQRAMRTGYDPDAQAVTVPWFTADGRLANVLYRSVRSKVFWYAQGGMPIRDLVYGMDVIYRFRVKKACLVEAPIDALYMLSCGLPAIAVGGATFSFGKRDKVIRSGIQELTLFTDNDRTGKRMQEKAVEQLRTYMTLRTVEYPDGCKDPCEVGNQETILAMYRQSKKI